MADQKHGVIGKPDPNFKPDPDLKMVFDQKKQVWRKTTARKDSGELQRKGSRRRPD